MPEYEVFFNGLLNMPPKMNYIPPDSGVIADFWEQLYQAFKARMIAESKGTQP